MTAEIPPETLRLAEDGAKVVESSATATCNPFRDVQLAQAAAIRSLVAHATETCEWKEDEDGVWHTACGNAYVINNGSPVENKMAHCCYCGLKLTETPRPATTGEMMGEG